MSHSFINKDKNVKKDIATHLKSLAYTVSKKKKKKENIQLEDFHEFLRACTDIFSKNVFNSEDFAYKNLKFLIQDENIVILQRDKDASVAIVNKSGYIQKLEDMIEEGISKDSYESTDDTALQDLKRLKDFMYRNLYNYENYHKMYIHSNQPAQLFRAAQTHKFKNIKAITK